MEQAKRTTRIFIADDNYLFRRGFHSFLGHAAGFCLVGEAGTSDRLADSLQAAKPDILVIDSDFLASQNVSQLRIAFRQAQPSLQILVLSAGESASSLNAAVTVGASGYMPKDSEPAHILATLVSIASQSHQAQPIEMTADLRALAHHTPETAINQMLTAREREVIRLLAEGKTVRTVAADLSLSTKTIEAHKLNLMRKLDIHDRASLIAYAAQNGMVAELASSR